MNEPQQPPAARASSSCLRCGLVLGLLTGVCLGSALFLRSRSESPDYVRGVLQELLPATIPPGYKPARALPLPIRDQQFVTIVPQDVEVSTSGPGDLRFVINVNAIPRGLEPGEFMDKLEGWLAADQARKLEIQAKQAITFQVRGEAVEGRDLQGVLGTTGAPLRLIWVPLLQDPRDPEQGWVLVASMGTPEAFDEAAVRAFLESVE